jgi:hypothetical protein
MTSFGKRDLPPVEAPSPDLKIDYPILADKPTSLEWLRWFWNVCELMPGQLGKGFISMGHHVLASLFLTVFILFLGNVNLTLLANTLKPYWPLLVRAQPYMDAHGRHQIFLFMAAMYFKDAMLAIAFLIWNSTLVVRSYGTRESNVVLFQI